MFDDFINLIPAHVRDKIRNRVVDILEGASSNHHWRNVMRSFRADAEFRATFDRALGHALQCFTSEHPDKALVDAMTQIRFWDLPSVQNALQEIITRPSSYLQQEHTILFHSFADALPTVKPERVEEAMNFFLRCLTEEVINIPQLAPIYQAQLQWALFEQSHRDHNELMTMLVEAVTQKQLLLADQPTALATPKVYHNLEPRYGEFFGRKQDVARVLEGLGSRWPLISIEGMGGIGKTTLATEIAYSCLPGPQADFDPPFEAVIWVSAKDKLEQKRWLNEVLDTTARVLGYPAITQMPLEQKPLEIDQLLCNYRTLVIVDNFETIEDPDLVAWIQRVPEPSKALITTRYGQLRRVWDIHLGGLAGSEALKLIRNQARRLELQPIENATEDALRDLVKVTEGNPRAIEMALGYIKHGKLSLDEVIEHLYTASKSVADLFNDLFARFWEEVLTKDAQQVLLVFPFFANAASKEALAATSGLAGYHLDSALEQLVELALLDINKEWITSSQHYSIHPLTRAFASARLREVPEFEEQARLRWSKYYLDFTTRSLVRENPPGRYWNTLMSFDGLKLIDPEWSNLRQVLEWAEQKGQDQILIELTLLLVHYMDTGVRNAERIYYVQRAAEAAKKLGHKEDEALFRIDGLGWTFIEGTRINEAEQQITLGLHIAENISNENPDAIDLVSLANTFMARVFLEQGDAEKASAFISKVEPTRCKPVIQYRTYMIIGEIAHKKHDNKEAIRLYEKAKLLRQEYGSEVRYRLGFAYLNDGDVERAEAEFNQVVLDGEWARLSSEVLYAKYGLASVAKAKGEREKAIQLARETKEELSRLVNSHRLLNQLDDFLKSLEAE